MLPQSVVVGFGRAGTTFLFDCMTSDPAVFVPTAKDTFFFDREYSRGIGWYQSHFARPSAQHAVDISHDYIFHPAAARRIRRHLGDVPQAILVREPVSWVESIVKREVSYGIHGKCVSLDEAISRSPGTLASGFYSHLVLDWISESPRSRVFVFDDLLCDPLGFYHGVAAYFGYQSELDVAPANRNRSLSARSQKANKLVRQVALVARERGLATAVGYVKGSPFVGRVMFDQSTEGSNLSFSEEVREGLQRRYSRCVQELSDATGRDLSAQWGYTGI